MSLDPRLKAWYSEDGGGDGRQVGHTGERESTTRMAFEEAVREFSKTQSCSILADKTSMMDVQAAVDISMRQYGEGKFPKVNKWLRKLSARICHYGNIMDVLVSHHPEYVALVWGAMKLLFVAVINHEKVMLLLTKALCQVADELPRAELAAELYRTKRMKEAVDKLYEVVLRFLVRAHRWTQASTLKHAWQSIAHPVELSWNDIVADMTGCSRRIDQLAMSGSQAELRHVHMKVDKLLLLGAETQSRSVSQGTSETLSRQLEVIEEREALLAECRLAMSETRTETKALGSAVGLKLSRIEVDLAEIKKQISETQALTSSGFIDTNHRITALQFSQAVSGTTGESPDLPMQLLRQHMLQRQKRAQQRRPPSSTDEFWRAPEFSQWSAAGRAARVTIMGSQPTRIGVRDFCLDVIATLRRADVPTLWLLKDLGDTRSSSLSKALQTLTAQALQLPGMPAMSERGLSMDIGFLQQTRSEVEWAQSLRSVLGRLGNRHVYLIVAQDALVSLGVGTDMSLQAWHSVLDVLTGTPEQPVIKVLLGSWSSNGPGGAGPLVQVRSTPQRRQQAQQMRRVINKRLGKGVLKG